MIKKTMTYTDYDGNSRTEDFYFNLSQGEVAELELSAEGGGGLIRMIENISATNNNKRLVEIFKDILNKSYGIKSEDGRRFIKSSEILENFTQTEAYSDLIVELISDADYCAKFIRGIVTKPVGKIQVAESSANKNQPTV